MLALSVLAVACSGDSSGPVGTGLTRVESLALAVSYFNVLEGSGKPVVAAPRFSAMADTTISNYQSSLPCPMGGVLELSMQDTVVFDQIGPRLTINGGGTHRPVGCVHRVGSTRITINATPPFVWGNHSVLIAGVPAAPIVETLNGAFAWSTNDGRNGSCNISYQRVVNVGAQTDTRGGTICGYTFTVSGN